MAKRMRLPNGYGCIEKLSGKRRKPYGAKVTIGYDPSGKQIRKYIGYFGSYKEALNALSEYSSNPYDIDINKFTLKEAFDKYKNWKFTDMSTSSINSYKAAFDKLEIYHNKPLVSISSENLQIILDDKNIGHGTKRKIIILFNQLYMYYSEDIPQLKKITLKTKLKQTKKDLPTKEKIFTKKEIKLLLDNLENYRDLDITLILLYTGFRINELLNIEIKNVNLQEKWMRGGNKTAASINRIVPIHPKIYKFIEYRYDENKTYLIRNKFNEKFKYSNFKRERFERLMQDLNMDHTPHDARHTVATSLQVNGADKISIRQILGHAGKDITENVYTHADIDDLHKNILYLDY
ncbi:site-specific integrase [Helcococcus bovis]|uniref:tyrosine-type recombinase/integrase n=1 Tax=Helcococcus bovis TaxID=3153252 RepID=UPI0038B908FD